MNELSKWIRNKSKGTAAPFFRKEFSIDNTKGTRATICGLGYYELHINGQRVGDHVLDPVVSHYDRRARYVEYDIEKYLKKGNNCIGVILGNGWYDPQTEDVFSTNKASWTAPVRFSLEMMNRGKMILISDTTWKTAFGPITFNALRNGEYYDARLEFGNWSECGFDDSAWETPQHCNPPGGILEPQTMPPCRITKTIPHVSENKISSTRSVYDFGVSMTGWTRITLKGEKGASVILRYSDLLQESGEVDLAALNYLIKSGEFQTDRYILKGGVEEIWEPRFTYHGFRYTQVDIEGKAEVVSIEAQFVHTDFENAGSFVSSSEMLNKIQACTRQSYLNNFTGIPTDCPHREKNGWTGDAQLAAEAGLFNFNSASSYAQWLDTMEDEQRPSGQLTGIVPCAHFGYDITWGGPAWESALLVIPWNIYLYRGDLSILKKHYNGFLRYMNYLESMSEDGIINFGLGDWCPPSEEDKCPFPLTSTAYYYADLIITAKTARLLGKRNDADTLFQKAESVKDAFNKEFYKGDGVYANGNMTATACPVYQGLVPEAEKEKCIRRLVKLTEENEAKAEFGILGAKYVPRVLAENGYIDLVYRMFTQEEFPGWGNWIRQGATTLWETWAGIYSRNHVMFGDISACMFQYFGGIHPDENAPGFKHFYLKPGVPRDLASVSVRHNTPFGTIVSDWKQSGGEVLLNVEIPKGSTATLQIPGSEEILKAGKYQFAWKLD